MPILWRVRRKGDARGFERKRMRRMRGATTQESEGVNLYEQIDKWRQEDIDFCRSAIAKIEGQIAQSQAWVEEFSSASPETAEFYQKCVDADNKRLMYFQARLVRLTE